MIIYKHSRTQFNSNAVPLQQTGGKNLGAGLQLKASGYIKPCCMNKTPKKCALNEREVGLGHSVLPAGHRRRRNLGSVTLRTEAKTVGTGCGSNNGGAQTPPRLRLCPFRRRFLPLGSLRISHQNSLHPRKRCQRQTEGVQPPSVCVRPTTRSPMSRRIQVFRLPHLFSPRLLDHYHSIIGGDGGRAADA